MWTWGYGDRGAQAWLALLGHSFVYHPLDEPIVFTVYYLLLVSLHRKIPFYMNYHLSQGTYSQMKLST